MRAPDVLDVDRRNGCEARETRLEDRHALGVAAGTHDDHDAAPRAPLDLTHDAADERTVAGGAAHALELCGVHEVPVHADTQGTGDASAAGRASLGRSVAIEPKKVRP